MCHCLLIQNHILQHFKPDLSTSWLSENLHISIYFLITQAAEMIGLSSDRSQAACPCAAVCSALGLHLGFRTKSREDLAEDTECSHTGAQQATPGETHHVLLLGYLSQASCKRRGNFFFRMEFPLSWTLLLFFSLEVNVSILQKRSKVWLIFNTTRVLHAAL